MKNNRTQNTEHRTHNVKSKKARLEEGLALVMVLVLSTIALAIMAGLIYMLTSGTQISGFQKRYKTALEAGFGGADVTYQLMGLRGDITTTNQLVTDLTTRNLNAFVATPNTCTGTNMYGRNYTGLAAKFNTPTTSWNANCDSSLVITPPVPGAADNTTYDMRFEIGTAPLRYRVYAKVVYTIEGNSEAMMSGGSKLGQGGVVNISGSGGGDISVMSVPYLYTVEIDSENRDNPAERAKLSILYQY